MATSLFSPTPSTPASWRPRAPPPLSSAGTTVVEGRPVDASPLFLLRVDDPYLAFLKVLVTVSPSPSSGVQGIHPTAVVASTAVLGGDVRLGARAVIGERCRIGDRTMIAPHAVIGDDAVVGPDALLYPNVTVREGCRIGARCIVHPVR